MIPWKKHDERLLFEGYSKRKDVFFFSHEYWIEKKEIKNAKEIQAEHEKAIRKDCAVCSKIIFKIFEEEYAPYPEGDSLVIRPRNLEFSYLDKFPKDFKPSGEWFIRYLFCLKRKPNG